MAINKEDIIKSIEARNAKTSFQRNLKAFFWDATVWLAYALKRAMDISFSLIALILLSPLMISVAIAIKIGSEGPIIFKQTRVGKNGRHFIFYKFRSMRKTAEVDKQKILLQNESKDGVIFKMKEDPRITLVGKFIRKYSIDELPQFFNVLEGSMSLVGPRPPLPDEVKEYTLEDRKRLHITPGITCIWQIAGRSNIPFKQQVSLDEEYIKNRGFFRDIVILLKTIPAVLTGRGAY
ncbi:MAG: sugar transferase [Verrucomicrobia bacterium]|nr:sugar transferase [Verrucomicrobiota bacterium]